MAQSPEYPDLPWMPPKSWTDANRTGVQLVVIHTTEGSATSSAAEDGASYDQRRTDGTSTHYFHDSNSTVQCVRTEDQAHAARTQGNKRGIQHELCTRAGSANWSDSYHQAMLRNAARQSARDAKKWGIPVKKLSSSQVADGAKGFCGHVDITNAFPQDNGTHTDPGSNFPWSQFLAMVEGEGEGDEMLPIKEGTQSEDVKHIQYLLKELGYDPGSVDGIYGDATAAAVNALRAAHSTGPDSAVSAWTYTQMQSDLAKKYAGKSGKDGAAGPQGPAGAQGPAGELTGTLTVTGGELIVEAA